MKKLNETSWDASHLLPGMLNGDRTPDFKEALRYYADDAAQEHHELCEHVPQIENEEHMNTLQDFTGFGAQGHNEYLLNGGKVEGLKHVMEAFRSASFPLHKRMHVYSGLKGWDPTEHMKNGIFHTPAFTSTSILPGVAALFTNHYIKSIVDDHSSWPGQHNANSHVIHFDLPKGYDKGTYLAHISHDPGEREYALHPGQTWKLKTIYGEDGCTKHPLKSGGVLHVWHVVPHEEGLHEAYQHSDEDMHAAFIKDRQDRTNAIYDHGNSYPGDIDWHSMQRVAGHLEWEHPSIVDQHTRLAKLFNPHFNSSHNNAIETYTSGSWGINNSLLNRNWRHTEYAHHIKNLDDMMKRAPALDHDVHVYSSLGFEYNGRKIFRSPAFISSSLNPHIAATISTHNNTKRKNEDAWDYHIMHVHLPKGYGRAAYIGGSKSAGGFDIQREMLLDRNAKYELIGHKKYTDYTFNSDGDHIHIWSFKPHEEALKEDTIHDTGDILQKPRGKTDYARIVEQHKRLIEHRGVKNVLSHTALDEYKDSSENVNRALINKHNKSPIAHAHYLNDAAHISELINIHGKPLPEDVHAYSGTREWIPDFHKHQNKRGYVITPAFTSTSLYPRYALAGFGTEDAHGVHHLLHFHLPKGFKNGLYLETYRENPQHNSTSSEFEYLIDKGQKWKFMGHDTHEWTQTHPHVGDKTIRVRMYHLVPHNQALKEAYATPDEIAAHMSQINKGVIMDDDSKFIKTNKSLTPIVKEEHAELLKVTPKFDITNREDAHRLGTLQDYSDDSEGLNMKMIHGSKLDEYDSEFITAFHHTKFELPHDLHVYSGLKYHNPEEQFTKGNGVIKFPAYTSASLHPEVATLFTPHNMNDPKHQEDSHIIHFHLPKGYRHGTYMAAYGNAPSEYEYTLHPGTFKLVGKETREFNSPRAGRKKLHVWHVVPHEQMLKEATGPEEHFDDRYGTAIEDIMRTEEGMREHTALRQHFGRPDSNILIGIKQFTENPEHIHDHYLGGMPLSAIGQHTHNALEEFHRLAAPLKQPLQVHSGMGVYDPSPQLENGVFKNATWMSASLETNVASNRNNFKRQAQSNLADGEGPDHIISFHLPAGSKHGIYVGHLSKFPSEREFILAPYKLWKVKRKDVRAGGRVVWHVEPHGENLYEAITHDPAHFTRDLYNGDSVKQEAFQQHKMLAVDDGESWRADTWMRGAIASYKAYSGGVNETLIDAHRLRANVHSWAENKMSRAILALTIKDAIKHHAVPLPQEMHVYSGTRNWNASNHIKNGILHTPAFTSTSLDPQVARRFADHSRESPDILHFHLPAGYKRGLYLEHKKKDHIVLLGEAEFLLDAGQKWKHVKTEQVESPYSDSNFNKIMYNVHTLVPHEDSHLHEAYEHNPHHIEFHRTENDVENFSSDKVPSHFKDEHDELAAHYKVKPKQRMSLSLYSDSSYNINSEVRAGPNSQYGQHALNISHAIEVSEPLQRDLHVYSGIGHKPPKIKGDLVHMPYFTSTSINPGVAKVHTNSKTKIFNRNINVHILHFHLPAGYKKGIYIAKYSSFAGETEYLLDHSQKFKINPTPDISDTLLPDGKMGKLHVWHLTPHEDELKETYKDWSKESALFGKPHERINWTTGRGSLYYKHQDDVDQAHADLTKLHHHKGTKQDRQIVHDYTSLGFVDIIKHQLSQAKVKGVKPPKGISFVDDDGRYVYTKASPDDVDKHYTSKVAALSNVIQRYGRPLHRDMHVYSGVGNFDPRRRSRDGLIHMPAFTSTSLNLKVASKFGPNKNGTIHILHFHLPKGFNGGMYVGHVDGRWSDHRYEYEYLLNAGHTWKHVGTHEMDNHEFVHHLIPASEELKEATFHDEEGFQEHRSSLFGRDVDAQHAHMSLMFGKAPTNDERQAFKDYKSDSAGLNNTLIGRYAAHDVKHYFPGEKERLLNKADELSRHIHSHAYPLPHDTHVYSGIIDFGIDSYVAKGNGIIHTPAFTSTSLDPLKAKWFADLASDNGRYSFLHFHLPAGYNRGAYIDSDTIRSWSHHEREYLLDKGQHWKLVKKSTFTDRVHRKPIDVWTFKPHVIKMHESYTPFTPDKMEKHWTKETLRHLYGYESDTDVVHFDRHMGEQGVPTRFEAPSHEHQHNHLVHLHDATVSNNDFEPTIRKYVMGDSATMNRELIQARHEDHIPENVMGHIDTLDRALDHAPPLDHDVHVYSGLGVNVNNITHNGIIRTPAFTSTSLNPTFAFGITKTRRLFNDVRKVAEHHIIHFQLPKGFNHGLYVGGLKNSIYSIQREMILRRGLKWHITGKHIHKIGDEREVHVTSVVPHEDHLKESYGPLSDEDLEKHFNKSKAQVVLDQGHYTRGYLNSWQWEDIQKSHSDHEWEHPEVTEQHARLNKLHGDVATPQQAESLRYYIQGRAREINLDLIAQHAKDEFNITGRSNWYAPLIDKAIRKAPSLDHEVHAFSALGFNPTKALSQRSGIFKTPAYTSTSINPHVAFGILAGKSSLKQYKNIGLHFMHFKLPAGYDRALYISPHAPTMYSHQRELLIRRNSKFQITGHKVHKTEGLPDIHIWTAEPHVPKTKPGKLEETTFHNKHFFSDIEYAISTPNGGTKVTDAMRRHQTMHYKLHALARADVIDQAHRLDNIKPQNLSYDEAVAVHNYTSDTADLSYLVNRRLLGNREIEETAHYQAHASRVARIEKHLPSALAKGLPLEEEMHVYSGLKHFDPSKYFDKHSGVIHTPAYVSTSLSPEIAKGFAGAHAGSIMHILHFHLPVGYKNGAFIANHSEVENEHEYLLNKGQKWKLVGKQTVNQLHKWRESDRLSGGSHIKIHIWSVVPHEDDLKEMAYHHDDKYDYSSDKSYMGLDMYQGRSDAVETYMPNHVEEHEHLKKLHGNPNGIDTSHISAVHSYTSSESYHLNNDLHKGIPLSVDKQKLHERLSKFLNEAPDLDKEYHVYSGLGSTDPTQGMHDTRILHSRAYMSASISPEIAAMHNSAKADWKAPRDTHIIHVRLPKGSKAGRYIAPHSWYEHEGEFLLKADQHYKIEHHEVMHDDEGYMMHIWHVTPLSSTLKEAFEHKNDGSQLYDAKVSNILSLRVKHQYHLEEDAHLRELHDYKTHPDDNAEHFETLHNFTESSSTLNTRLLTKSVYGVHKRNVKHIDDYLNNAAPLQRNIHVYSGLRGWSPSVSEGETFTTPTYISTSIDPGRASAHANDARISRQDNTYKSNVDHVIHFDLPAGFTGGRYLGRVSKYEGEMEFLLKRNQKWKVVKHEVRELPHGIQGTITRHIWHVTPLNKG